MWSLGVTSSSSGGLDRRSALRRARFTNLPTVAIVDPVDDNSIETLRVEHRGVVHDVNLTNELPTVVDLMLIFNIPNSVAVATLHHMEVAASLALRGLSQHRSARQFRPRHGAQAAAPPIEDPDEVASEILQVSTGEFPPMIMEETPKQPHEPTADRTLEETQATGGAPSITVVDADEEAHETPSTVNYEDPQAVEEALTTTVGDAAEDGYETTAEDSMDEVFAVPAVGGSETLNGQAEAVVDGQWSLPLPSTLQPTDVETDDGSQSPDASQRFKELIFFISEEQAKRRGYVHRGYTCNICQEYPIRSTRYRCANCTDYDVCFECEARVDRFHPRTHVFLKINVPTSYLNARHTKAPVLYSGDPTLKHEPLSASLKRRLVRDTSFVEVQLSAFYDQFMNMVTTRWPEDPTGVCLAINRMSFNTAVNPRGLVGPNLISDRVFAFYDTDNNGLIGFEEFVFGLACLHFKDKYLSYEMIFNGYDLDNDGFVSRKDFLRIFRAKYVLSNRIILNTISAELDQSLEGESAQRVVNSLGQPTSTAFQRDEWTFPAGPPRPRPPKTTDRFGDQQPPPQSQNIMSGPYDQEEDRHAIVEAVSGAEQARHRARLTSFYTDEEEGVFFPDGRDSSARRDFSGYKIPEAEKDAGKEILYQILQEGNNQLLDPLFRPAEEAAFEVESTKEERRKWRHNITRVNSLNPTPAYAAKIPSKQRLRHLAHLNRVEEQIEQRGGPGRIDLTEFETFMESGDGSEFQIASGWLEWASF
ncbi:hypothetical protein B0A49_05484 [Cryomyces minteri]|uniref:EF-hand n=1 Tax=Cryomyces minteri TaxID=331657 RepID=A0A4U0XKB0_9PEZI|nr:hypothetical protein B0A49_05484 [Cryomyces minteri]